jgi:hypothetical protein
MMMFVEQLRRQPLAVVLIRRFAVAIRRRAEHFLRRRDLLEDQMFDPSFAYRYACSFLLLRKLDWLDSLVVLNLSLALVPLFEFFVGVLKVSNA